jgi:hypothetical protein
VSERFEIVEEKDGSKGIYDTKRNYGPLSKKEICEALNNYSFLQKGLRGELDLSPKPDKEYTIEAKITEIKEGKISLPELEKDRDESNE